jgi:hypothetical protein
MIGCTSLTSIKCSQEIKKKLTYKYEYLNKKSINYIITS